MQVVGLRGFSVYIHPCIHGHVVDTVMGVMTMGNIVPRTRLQFTSLAFRASVLSLNHIGLVGWIG